MAMETKTLRALLDSIKKWEAIVDGTGADNGSQDCALCQEFRTVRHPIYYCHGCPVMDKTKRQSCVDTPYGAWLDTFGRNRLVFAAHKAETPEQKAAAQVMLDFLRSLVPPRGVSYMPPDKRETHSPLSIEAAKVELEADKVRNTMDAMIKAPARSAVVPWSAVPGDVANVDGDIVLRTGGIAGSGTIWVSTEQAMRAAAYGWRKVRIEGCAVQINRDLPL